MDSKIKILRLEPGAADYSADVARLYAFEGWISPGDDISGINRAVAASYCAFAAYDGGRMVGFFRALSDGVGDAYLLDLVVDPAFRGRGIGSALAGAVIGCLRDAGIAWITCISNPGVERLYEHFGKKMAGFTPMRF